MDGMDVKKCFFSTDSAALRMMGGRRYLHAACKKGNEQTHQEIAAAKKTWCKKDRVPCGNVQSHPSPVKTSMQKLTATARIVQTFEFEKMQKDDNITQYE
jgi:hypothetical protein